MLVSHDLCQALRTADRVALLADGRLCMAGTPEQVYAGGALDRVFGVPGAARARGRRLAVFLRMNRTGAGRTAGISA